MKSNEPKRIGEVVSSIVKGPARKAARAISLAERRWQEVVGPEIAAHTRVLGFSRRVLTIGVDSSALLAELSGFYRGGLLESLQSGEKPLAITDLRFEVDARP